MKHDDRMYNTHDNVAKIQCPVNSCDWSIIWHQFGWWVEKKNLKCERCNTKAEIKPAKTTEICKLRSKKHAVPESKKTHYDKNGVRRTIRLL